MVAILESPAIRRQVQPLSVKGYELLGERIKDPRTELIRGIVLEKTPASPLHVFLVAALRDLILALSKPGLYYREEKPLKTSDSMPEPDLAVVAGRKEDYLSNHPDTALLVVEIALSSLDLDREKAVLYAEANIPEYWIVIGEQKAVEVFTDPQDGLYTQRRRYTLADTLTSSALPGLIVNLAALFPAG